MSVSTNDTCVMKYCFRPINRTFDYLLRGLKKSTKKRYFR